MHYKQLLSLIKDKGRSLLLLAIASCFLVSFPLVAGSQPSAQLRPEEVAPLIYDRLPDLPKENQYISKATGEVAKNNTFALRLMRYHFYVKDRPPYYRLDWKLTLADYLGVNEPLQIDRYPGYDTLQTNPVEGDRAAARGLNRKQREALVNLLASIYNPNAAGSGKSKP